ncbi:MAG TPA: PilZ domain-containing protein [Acidimicrobiales bacterium]|nr:PilZ domain-containing protein [Acidimicrobiales bacterium]
MPFAWRPVAGQLALIELADGSRDCLTGVVVGGDDDDDAVVIDLGASPQPPGDAVEVVASFFAPDALYRVNATASPHDGRAKIVDLTVHRIERVQRRATPRARVVLPATLSNFDDPGAFVSVIGDTVDLGQGGCRVRTRKAFPGGCDPTVTLTLPNGGTVVALAAVLQSETVDDGFEYRLVFLEIDDVDRDQISGLVSALVAA